MPAVKTRISASASLIGIDEIAIRKGHTYRIVVSDLLRGRPIWFGGKDRFIGHSWAELARDGCHKHPRR